MPDWTRSMKQTYEYYEVDPLTWRDKRRIPLVEKCNMTRDEASESLGTSSISCPEDLTDKYVRTYLITEQDGRRERFVLGTYIYETPARSYDGKRMTHDMDGYTPLIELKEKIPPVGYAIRKGANILETACQILGDPNICRTPFVSATDDHALTDHFVADMNDTWLFFLKDLVDGADYKLGLDELGRIIFEKKTEVNVCVPRWTYTDDNSSILQPEVEITADLFNTPNVVEVVYSPQDGDPISAIAENNSPDSIASTVTRGRRVVYRETDPKVANADGEVPFTEDHLQVYADNLLREMSAIEYEVSYTHGYCPVRVGDAVRLNYRSAGLENVIARVTKQTIDCKDGCQVEETAVFTKKLWE